MRSSILAATCLVVASSVLAGQAPPYRDARLPVDARVRDLVGRMTLEEKFWQLFMIPGDLDDPSHDYSHGVFGLQIRNPARPAGAEDRPTRPAVNAEDAGRIARAHADRINAIQRYFVERTRLGIPIIPFEEAVHGLGFDGGTMFPAAIALAATWDTALVGRVALAVARETGSRGVRQVLSPVINIARDVRWGRVEETYGEDPLINALMGAAFVAPFERLGIVTTPKHFLANVGDGGRDSYPIAFSERELTEVYLPPFEAAVRAGARSIMTSYNSVDGSPATQNSWLLNTVLKGRWGFSGFVISDAAATGGATVLHLTEPSTPVAAQHAFRAGLDVVFQSSWPQHRPYLEAFTRGLVPESVMNAAVSRVLRAKFELGLFERPYANSDSAAWWNGNLAHRALARQAAQQSIVLLKNERSALPLSPLARSVAVIGVDAGEARLGGYSGPGIAPVSIVDGLRQALPRVDVRYVPGPGRFAQAANVVPAAQLSATVDGRPVRGLTAEYFDNPDLSGEPRLRRTDERVDARWTFNAPGRGIAPDWFSVRWTGTIKSPLHGVRRIGVEGNDGFRLWIDGQLVVDRWRKESYRAELVNRRLPAGSAHAIRLEFRETRGNGRVRLVWDAGEPDDSRARIDSAVAVARRSDIAIVVAGIEEGEFRDRAFLGLPGHQEELIEAVAATGRRTIVVLVGGSAITMSRWLPRVQAVVMAWYPGEEGGNAVADVLTGAVDPGGRLPITFPMSEGQLPLYYNHKPTGRGDWYVDQSGEALFPFGFGLSYTTFEYSGLRIASREMGPSDTEMVSCTVRNTGQRVGSEVVQLYIRDVLASVAQPVMALKGFERVVLQPGESREVRFLVGPEQLRLLDAGLRWVVEAGVFRVMVGSSSRDIRLRGELTVR